VSGLSCDYLDRVRRSVSTLADLAFAEDLPAGDVTAEVLELAGRTASARIICREPVVMCGAAWYGEVLAAFERRAPSRELRLRSPQSDGSRLAPGSVLFDIRGDVAAIVALERTLLNFLARAIGIANATATYVAAVRTHNLHTQILETRKKKPGYRYFDKYAVLCGGGANHRLNLSDQVLIKENHMARLGGVSAALAHVERRLAVAVPIEVEVRDLDQLAEAIAARCPLIMLDNFTPEMVRRATALPRGNSLLEVSGGVTLSNIGDYCRGQPGHLPPDRISIGVITHSITAPDLSLLISEE